MTNEQYTRWITALKVIREEMECQMAASNDTSRCAKCGAAVDKDILELTDKQLILTYTCRKCGTTADQYFNLQYDKTDIM